MKFLVLFKSLNLKNIFLGFALGVFFLVSVQYEEILNKSRANFCAGYQSQSLDNGAVTASPTRQFTPGAVTKKTTSIVGDKIIVGNIKTTTTTKRPPYRAEYSANGTNYVVPNIAHFTWYTDGEKTFRFHNLLSILSAHRIMKAETIYFYCNYQPVGKYWEEAKREIPNLKIIARDPPTEMYGVTLKPAEFEISSSDVDRVRIVLENGGVYIDLDLLIINPLEPLRIHQTTVGIEMGTLVCGGFIMSAPHATFMYLWVHTMLKDYRSEWGYISNEIPSQLVETYPGIVHVENTTIHNPDYNHFSQLLETDYYDWSKNYAIHLWYRLWPKWFIDPNPSNIKKMNSTLGQIARKIYYGSPDMF